MEVRLGKKFAKHYSRYLESDQDKIDDFIEHVESIGLNDLPGKLSKSDNVRPDDPQYLYKVKRAQRYKLWHYHIGIPKYNDSPNGYSTSEYVLHFSRINESTILIVDMTSHPPFELPKEDYLAEVP